MFLRKFLFTFCISYLVLSIVPYKDYDFTIYPFYKKGTDLIDKYCVSKKNHRPNQILVLVKHFKDSQILAECQREPFRYIIRFNSRTLVNYSQEAIQSIMYHELAHCELNLDHSKDESNYLHTYYNININDQLTELQFVRDIEKVCGYQ